jgi:hypothetical protein
MNGNIEYLGYVISQHKLNSAEIDSASSTNGFDLEYGLLENACLGAIERGIMTLIPT